MDRKDVVIIGLIVTILATVTVTVILLTVSIHGSGTIVEKNPNLGAFADMEATTAITNIDWGTLSPGESSSTWFYLKNTGNVPLNVTMNITNWSPVIAGTYITITWDKPSQISILEGEVVEITITLTVHDNCIGITDFSQSIEIIGTD